MGKKSGRVTKKITAKSELKDHSVNKETCKWTRNVRIAVIRTVIFVKEFGLASWLLSEGRTARVLHTSRESVREYWWRGLLEKKTDIPVDSIYPNWNSKVMDEVTPQGRPNEGGMTDIKEPRRSANYSHDQCHKLDFHTILVIPAFSLSSVKFKLWDIHAQVFLSAVRPRGTIWSRRRLGCRRTQRACLTVSLLQNVGVWRCPSQRCVKSTNQKCTKRLWNINVHRGSWRNGRSWRTTIGCESLLYGTVRGIFKHCWGSGKGMWHGFSAGGFWTSLGLSIAWFLLHKPVYRSPVAIGWVEYLTQFSSYKCGI